MVLKLFWIIVKLRLSGICPLLVEADKTTELKVCCEREAEVADKSMTILRITRTTLNSQLKSKKMENQLEQSVFRKLSRIREK